MDHVLVLILGYAAVMLVAGFFLSKNKTVQDFLVAGRSNSGFVMAAGMVIGALDAMWFTLFSGMGFTMGWSFLWVIVGVFLGVFCLDAMAGKIKADSTQQKMLTVTDWFYHHFGVKTGRIVGLIVTVNFMGWLAAVFVSAGLIISSVFDLDYSFVILTGAVIILPLLLKGGYASLTRFDVLQFFIVAIGLILVYAFGFKEGAKPAVPAPETITMLGFWGTVSVIITMFSTMFCASDVWQRTYAAKDVREVQVGFKWAYIFWGASLLATALFGMTARNAGYQGGENDVFTFVFKELLTNHAQALFLLILMAAVTSTLNVAIFSSALSIANDYMRHDLSEQVLQKRIKVIMVLVVMICAGGALLTQDVMTLALAVISFSTCVAPVLLISVVTNIRLSDWTGFLSILVSTGTYLGLLITGSMKPEYSALPFALNLGAVILIEPVVRLCRRGAVSGP